MPNKKERRTTQRAYTLRLKPAVGGDPLSWRALAHTHDVFNEGVRLWTDLLLTFCGGLHAGLAQEGVDTSRMRRVFLALSWLRVETADPLNEGFRVMRTDLPAALESILREFQLSEEEIAQWKKDCHDVFLSPIKEGACWVNRALAYSQCRFQPETRTGLWDLVGRFATEQDYFNEVDLKSKGGGQRSQGEEAKSAKIARGWLSQRLGSGKGQDFEAFSESERAIAKWAERLTPSLNASAQLESLALELKVSAEPTKFAKAVVSKIGARATKNMGIDKLIAGNPLNPVELHEAALRQHAADSAKVGRKYRVGWANAWWKEFKERLGLLDKKDNTDLHSEILGQSAIRVFSNWTWIKRSIAEREAAGRDRCKLDQVPAAARDWLDEYCESRSGSSGAQEGYRIRRRAIQGWKEVVETWDDPDVQTERGRRERVGDVQAARPDPEKFGDAALFLDLSAGDAECVWRYDGKPRPDILDEYVGGKMAEYVYLNRKVPALCHVDAERHPVFYQCGKSRPGVRYGLQNRRAGADLQMVELQLIHPNTGMLEWFRFRWQGKRAVRELRPADGTVQAVEAGRRDRLSPAAAGIREGTEVDVRPFSTKEDPVWNARVQFPRARMAERNVATDRKTRAPNGRGWFLTLSAELTMAECRCPPKWSPGKDGEKRGGLARPSYSRHEPGLRVLGVDLGQRFAAACAVWETLSREQMAAVCKKGGVGAPGEDALHLAVPAGSRRLIFRRVAGDTLPDGTPHPAPWARLERSFLIKLQGEDRDPRKATAEEQEALAEMLQRIGMKPKEQPKRVDDAMRIALREARRHVNRLGEMAKTANAMAQCDWDCAAKSWTRIAGGESAIGRWSGELWTELAGEPPPGMEQRRGRNRKGELEAALAKLAEVLRGNPAGNKDLARRFKEKWEQEEATGREAVRWLRRWIVPKGKYRKEQRHVGGLSLARINNLMDLYRLEKAWATRPNPEEVSSKQINESFCARILAVRDQLRENRVRKTASRIVEAALGIGAEPGRNKDGRAIKRARAPKDNPRHAACQVIAIENLSGYGTAETRLRRENRALMNWAKSRVKQRIHEGCEMCGLRLEEVIPNYTSRQDSRTGAPGIRCEEVDAETWLSERLPRLKARNSDWGLAERSFYDSAERYAHEAVHLKEGGQKGGGRKPRFLVPNRGGEVFVSSDPASPIGGGIQADLNAAANIGIRVLMDPDWAGRWWYVPVEVAKGKVKVDSLKGCLAPGIWSFSLKKKGEGSGIRNYWRAPSAEELDKSAWVETVQYWQEAEERTLREALLKQFENRNG